MNLKHNKKRNTGLLREFFSLYISECIVNEHGSKIDLARNVWSKYFLSKTEIRKEMKLFSTVAKYAIENKKISESVAVDLVSNIKKYVKTINENKLELEKTNLIREINDSLGEDFFNKKVKNYNHLASIQILFNQWKKRGLNEGIINPAIIELEDRLITLFTSEKQINEDKTDILNKNVENEIDTLVVEIMRKKLNERFGSFTNEQKNLLKNYVFNDKPSVTLNLENIKNKVKKLIDVELGSDKPSKQQKDKLKDIKELVDNDYKDTQNINENTLTFYMGVAKLCEELSENGTNK
jgi:hypothetical protein